MFFPLDLPICKNFPYKPSDTCLWVQSGRAALEFILRVKASMHGKKGLVYLPRYTCETVIERLDQTQYPYVFYTYTPEAEINLESLPTPQQLHAEDSVVFTNFWGLKHRYIKELAQLWGKNLILDNSLALYDPPLPHIPTIYSPRKWSGLSDGGIVCWTEQTVQEQNIFRQEWQNICLNEQTQDFSDVRASYLLTCLESGPKLASEACQRAEDSLSLEEYFVKEFRDSLNIEKKEERNKPLNHNFVTVKRMSQLTSRLIESYDYEAIARKRLNHFIFLHQRLKKYNKWSYQIDNLLKESLMIENDKQTKEGFHREEKRATENSLYYFLEAQSADLTAWSPLLFQNSCVNKNIMIPYAYPFATNLVDLRNYLIDHHQYISCFWPYLLKTEPSYSAEYELTLKVLPLPIDHTQTLTTLSTLVDTIDAYFQV